MSVEVWNMPFKGGTCKKEKKPRGILIIKNTNRKMESWAGKNFEKRHTALKLFGVHMIV